MAEASSRSASKTYVWMMIALGCLYVCTSAGLISFNKYLMSKDRFPYAIVMVLIQGAFCSTVCFLLYLVKPDLFPSLSDPSKRVAIDRDLLLKGALPIGFFYSGQLILSNTAYLHSSVAFLQMMKEANLVIVYVMSLAAALEQFSCRNVNILLFVLCATAMTITGELNFSLTGFTIQGTGQLFECSRIVLQALLLTAAGKKLDALTYVMVVMPICFLFLVVMLFFMVFVMPIQHFDTPSWAEVGAWAPALFCNACVALALNIIIALFVKNSSAVAFILAGIVKDACIVGAGTFFLGEEVSGMQGVGFFFQLSAILVWGLVKTFPDKFAKGLFPGLLDVLFGKDPETAQQGLAENVDQEYGSIGKKDTKC